MKAAYRSKLCRPLPPDVLSTFKQQLIRRLSQNTAAVYTRCVEICLVTLGIDLKRPVQIGDMQNRRLLQHWADAVPGSPATRQLAVFSVRRFLRHLKMEEITRDDVGSYLEVAPVPRRPPQFLLIPECERLMRQPLVRPGRGLRRVLALRDHAILWLLWAGGLRACETVSLDIERLKLDQPARGHYAVLVRGKGDRWRWVTCPRRAYRAMARYLEVRDELGDGPALFLTQERSRIGRRRIYQLVKDHGTACGLDTHPHMLRHSCATHLLWMGAELAAVQAHLGHAQIQTTLLYAHTNLQHLHQKATLHHPGERAAGQSLPTVDDRLQRVEGQLGEALEILKGIKTPWPAARRRTGAPRLT